MIMNKLVVSLIANETCSDEADDRSYFSSQYAK